MDANWQRDTGAYWNKGKSKGKGYGKGYGGYGGTHYGGKGYGQPDPVTMLADRMNQEWTERREAENREQMIATVAQGVQAAFTGSVTNENNGGSENSRRRSKPFGFLTSFH